MAKAFKTVLLQLFSLTLLISCSTIPKAYDRSEWGGWRTKNCINTRHLILKNRSIQSPELGPRGCKVKAGLWIDFYTGEKINLNDKPHIDHVIPLKYAHMLGAHKWSKARKNSFYNDHKNLVITSRSMNLEKKDKSFLNWHPLSHNLACKYANQWVSVKLKYGLQFSRKECFNFEMLQKTKPCPTPIPKIKICT